MIASRLSDSIRGHRRLLVRGNAMRIRRWSRRRQRGCAAVPKTGMPKLCFESWRGGLCHSALFAEPRPREGSRRRRLAAGAADHLRRKLVRPEPTSHLGDLGLDRRVTRTPARIFDGEDVAGAGAVDPIVVKAKRRALARQSAR
jgi:hypothetical protein